MINIRNILFLILFHAILGNQDSMSQTLYTGGFSIGTAFSKQKWNFENTYILGLYRTIFINLDFKNPDLTLVFHSGLIDKGTGMFYGIVEPENKGPFTSIEYFTNELRLSINKHFKPVTIFIVIGPRVDYLVQIKSSQWDYKDDDIRSPINYNKFYFGLSSGIGVNKYFSRVMAGLSMNYLQDITRVVNRSTSLKLTNDVRQVTTRSYLIQLNLGYIIGLTGKKVQK